jgi:Chaperone of endosialidase
MTTTLNASTAGAGGFIATGDNSGSLALQTAGTTAVTIDTSQNVGIGISSPTQGKVAIKQSASTIDSGLAIQAQSNDSYFSFWNDGSVFNISAHYNSTGSYQPIAFRTSNTERMRIDSSGFLKARANGGSYFSGSYNTIQNNNNVSGDVCLVIGNNSGSATNNTSSKFLACADNAADRLFIYGNGNVVNANNSYGAISDIKLKENIVDASPKLANLMQVKVRNYNLIGETTRQIGVVAQELETVFPAMIDESSDRDKEGNDLGTTTKSVKYSVFVPMLIKAIQELKAINDTQAETINALTARVVALESK